MSTDPRAELRTRLADWLLSRWIESADAGKADLPMEGQCDDIAGWVMELFPEVRFEAPFIVFGGAASPARFVLRTAPEPTKEKP